MSLVEYYDAYSRMGLVLIPLQSRSKKPFHPEWNKGGIADARSYFAKDESLNMGVILGEIVDVEGDTPEANKFIDDLVGKHPHPRYRSRKSVHHLFRNPDPSLTRFVVADVEFRAHKHQSCIPPSRHESGDSYEWLGKSEFPIGEMPDRLLEFFQEQRARQKAIQPHKSRFKPGHVSALCSECGDGEMIHGKRHALEIIAFKNRRQRWKCHRCRDFDLREECRYLRSHLKR